MTTNHLVRVTALAGLVLAIAVLLIGFAQRSSAEIDSAKCNVSTITPVAIGNQFSVQVLATSTNRAYAIVQQVRDNTTGFATSTVSLSFNEDVGATVNNGIQLSTTTPELTFGMNTDFPYDGAVRALTNVGSTTLRVTECLY